MLVATFDRGYEGQSCGGRLSIVSLAQPAVSVVSFNLE